MSKRGYISRYLLILRKLRSKSYCSFDEIGAFIHSQSEYLQIRDEMLSVGFSKRTFQRDLREIRNLFGIDIDYSRKDGGYFISQDKTDNKEFQKMLDAFDIYNSLNLSREFEPYLFSENHRPQGTENFFGLLHAIKKRQLIKFFYRKFFENEAEYRIVESYALKEFKNRWYLLAKDLKDNLFKSFALDRLSEFEILNRKFIRPPDFSIEEYYKYCFGIIFPKKSKPEDIVLSFDPNQGKYIKSLPLHISQQVIRDNSEELRIKLRLYITSDFIMEILSHGENVKVISPSSLSHELKKIHQKAFSQY